MKRTMLPLLLLLPLLAGCDTGGPEAGAGGIPADDARALDRAAEKLDARQANPPLFPEEEGEAERGD